MTRLKLQPLKVGLLSTAANTSAMALYPTTRQIVSLVLLYADKGHDSDIQTLVEYLTRNSHHFFFPSATNPRNMSPDGQRYWLREHLGESPSSKFSIVREFQ